MAMSGGQRRNAFIAAIANICIIAFLLRGPLFGVPNWPPDYLGIVAGWWVFIWCLVAYAMTLLAILGNPGTPDGE